MTGSGSGDLEATAVGAGSSWATDRGNTQRTGHAWGTALEAEPTVAWTQEADGDSLTAIDGKVFTAGDGFAALDAASGEPKWRVSESETFENGGGQQPTVVGDTVVQTTSGSSTEGAVYAFDAETGDRLWAHEVAEIHHAPLVVDGTVYVSPHRELYAWDLESGEEKWTLDTGGAVSAIGDTVYFADRKSKLFELDPSSGSKNLLHETTILEPSYVDETVYHFSASYEQLVATDLSSGDASWTFDLDTLDHTRHAIAGDLVLAGTHGGELYAIDREDGSERWTATTSGAFRTPIVVRDTVYLATADGAVVALSLDDGSERWQKDLGDGWVGSPAYANGTLYVVHDGEVKALESN
nr:PQQ-binding-like beta-propeller repeat protein [Halorubellus sp. JP-L1]